MTNTSRVALGVSVNVMSALALIEDELATDEEFKGLSTKQAGIVAQETRVSSRRPASLNSRRPHLDLGVRQ